MFFISIIKQRSPNVNATRQWIFPRTIISNRKDLERRTSDQAQS
jgi:hypothetical protein